MIDEVKYIFNYQLTCTAFVIYERSITVTVHYETSFSIEIVRGIRLRPIAINEVVLRFHNVHTFEQVPFTQQWQIDIAPSGETRSLIFTKNNTSYRLIAEEVKVEKHEKFCYDDNGNRVTIEQRLKLYETQLKNGSRNKLRVPAKGGDV